MSRPRPSLLALLLILLAAVMAVQATAGPRVLLLNSYHPQYAWTAELTRGVRDELKDVVAEDDLHIEYLDGRRMAADPLYFNVIEQLLLLKYGALKPDVIMTSDDYALHFMRERGRNLFGETPVIFSGVKVFEPDLLTGLPQYTGLLEGMEIARNLDLIADLQPNVLQIILLADKTPFGQRLVNHARELLSARQNLHWRTEIKIEIWDDIAWPELLERSRHLPLNSALLLLNLEQDNNGRPFSLLNDLPELTAQASVPVYGMRGGQLLGQGVLGGIMNDPYQHGRSAAQMVKRLLTGSTVAALPIVDKADYEPYFDARVLKRFGINSEKLPAGSTVYFQERHFYQDNQQLIWQVAMLVVALLVLSVVLGISLLVRHRHALALKKHVAELQQRGQERSLETEIKSRQLENLIKQVNQVASTDMLTELANRRAGQELLQHMLQRREYDRQALSIGLLDIDHFKAVNDQHGHDIGDEVLRHVAHQAQHSLRPLDRIFRWGGEEFLLLLPGADVDIATRICERVRAQIASEFCSSVGFISASIGVASLADGESLHSWLKRSDNALHKAKTSGRDCVVADRSA